MKKVELENNQAENTTSAKRVNSEEKLEPKEKPPIKAEKLSLKMKIILFASIGFSVCLIVAIVMIVLMTKKSNEKYDMEISDLETEKEVLETQNARMKTEIQNLTKSNIDLNKTLNEKMNQVSIDEIKRNKTYNTLDDISKEGVALKTTFSKISKNIEVISIAKADNIQQENKRELAENVSNLKGQLELINALMAQISLNLDLVNQNKELLSSNINLANQLNHQVINNTLLVNENQNLIKEKIDLNDKLSEQIEINDIQNLKIKQLENELEEANKKYNTTCTNPNNETEEEKGIIEELKTKMNEEIKKNKLLNEEIINLQAQVTHQNNSLQNCLKEKENLEKEKENLNSDIHKLYNDIQDLISNNSNLLEEILAVKNENINYNISNNNLKNELDICNKESKQIENEKKSLELENENLIKNLNKTITNLTYCLSQIEISKIRDDKISSELIVCRKNLSFAIAELNNLGECCYKSVICQKDLNNCKKKNHNLTIINNKQNNTINALTAKHNKCLDNYNTCKAQLSYYITLPNEIKKLKEHIAQLNSDLNYYIDLLNKCYVNCPNVEYDKITSEMQSTIHELIVYAYTNVKSGGYEAKARYITDRMSQVYNKARWSCLLAKTSSYYGYYVRYINNLYYTYTYRSIKWIVFVGYYN